MMKKFLYMIGVVSILLMHPHVANAESFYTNNNGIEMTESEYNNLLNMAFTEDQIERMDYQTFIDNKDLVGSVVADTIKYQKITTTIRNGIKTYAYSEVTEQEAMLGALQGVGTLNPGVSPNASGTFYDGLSWDSYRIMESYIVNFDDVDMRYKVDVRWITMPSDRSYDIIGIGIEPAKVHLASLIMFRADWKTGSGDLDFTDVCSPKYETTGGSAVFELPTGSLQKLEAYTYFNVYKNNDVGTLNSIIAVGDYAHATDNVDVEDMFDYYTVNHVEGISVDEPYHNDYESSTAAVATFLGTW
jgi:hypothetical protein